MKEFTRPQPNCIFNVPNFLGLTYLTKLRADITDLLEHKFRHNFLNQIFNFGNATESTKHYLIQCSNFKNESQSFLENVRIVNPDLLSMNEGVLAHLFLYDDNTLTDNTNTFLLNSVIENITSSTNRFNDLLIL